MKINLFFILTLTFFINIFTSDRNKYAGNKRLQSHNSIQCNKKQKSQTKDDDKSFLVVKISNNKNEIIDINKDEPLLLKTFKELIEEKEKAGKPYILARVITKHGDTKFYHYYDAHYLNQYFFGDNYLNASNVIKELYKNLRNKDGRRLKNPYNNLSVKGIEYYILKPSGYFEYLTFNFCLHNDASIILYNNNYIYLKNFLIDNQ
jgi:hypothetical protein